MSKLTNQQLLNLTKDLIAIESTAHNPDRLRQAYELVVRMILESGKEITIEQFESGGRPSFLAYKDKSRPDNFRIILNGHLDVVPGKADQYKAVVKDGKLYGRGAYDMKAAAIILADAFCEFVDKVPYALGLQIVTDEETTGKHGTSRQVEQGVRADFVICGDCGRSSTAYEIANQTKGIAVADVGFTGNSAHSAYPWRGDNAIMHAMEFGHALHQVYPTPKDETFQTTATIMSISTSNTAHNSVPADAMLRINARFTNDDPNFASKEAFTALIKRLDPKAKVLAMHDFCKPAYTRPDDPLLCALKASAEQVEGHPFTFVMRHGTGDGRFYTNVGSQACEFGVAGEHQHGDDEHITIKAFNNYRATMQDFLAKTISG